MRGGTLFSGICAPETACPEIDWRWRAEIDPFANAVAEYRHPGIPNLGDVRGIDPDAVEPVDIVVFGSPCQAFSVAGKRLGLDDPRGNLALLALGVIGRIRPRWLVFENVPGLFSSYSGSEHAERAVREGPVGGRADGEENRDFAAFLSRLRECGYLGCWRVLDAQYLGVPQRRRRVFVVGYLGDWRPPAAVLFERESLSGNPAPRREAGEDVAGTIAAGAHPGGYNGQDAYSGSLIAHSLRADGFDASEDGMGRGTPLVPVPIDMRQASRGGRFTNNRREGSSGGAPGTGIGNPGDPCPTLADSHTPAVAFDTAQITSKTNRSNPRPGDPCHTLHSGATHHVADCMAVRRLTPTECEALQGFPRNYTLVPYRGKPAADGPRYRALGNSMAVPVMHWILSRVLACEALLQVEAA